MSWVSGQSCPRLALFLTVTVTLCWIDALFPGFKAYSWSEVPMEVVKISHILSQDVTSLNS